MSDDRRDSAPLDAPKVFFDVRAQHLYVHVPFCARRCVYCDFSIAVRSRVPVDEYLEALEREWRTRHSDSAFDLETLYFGGGTPSKLGGSGVQRMMDIMRCRAELQADAEITLEANPEDVTLAAVRDWRAAGVNRVSLGVQSFQDSVLAWMHRTHDAAGALRAIQVLREGGIANISIDLIFAVPASTERQWGYDLDAALELDVPHISVYGLTVESHTPLGRWVARSDVTETPEDAFEAEYLRAHDALTRAGFEHYEVSNYGKSGQHSRHNWAYWTRRSYGGLGPSAHEFDGVERRWNAGAYTDWVGHSSRGEDSTVGREVLDREQAAAEILYLDLRTNRGLAIGPSEREHLCRFEDAGWGRVSEDSRFRLTGLGWLRLDAIACDLTLVRSR